MIILRSFGNLSKISILRLLSPSFDDDIIVCYNRSKLCLYTSNGKLMRQAIFEHETIQSKVLNVDSQYTVIGSDRVFVQIIRTHDLQPVCAYSQCDVGDQKKQYVLLPGGAGFIGSHCVIELITVGYTPIVVDNECNLSAGEFKKEKKISNRKFDPI
ncbi:unnamed protein product, partial [Rotaria sp. Silwood2]